MICHPISKSTVLKWSGVCVSIICCVYSGTGLAFNVYAVQMKELFQLTQTQVEVLGSSTSAGWSFSMMSAFVITKFGYKIGYVVSGSLFASSFLLLWMATYFVDFFREWSGLLAFYQFAGTAGASVGIQSCITVGVQHFPRHIGKLVGVYLAAASSGEIYFSFMCQVFFPSCHLLGRFFLTLAISYLLVITLCCVLHQKPPPRADDSLPLIGAEDKSDQSGTVTDNVKPRKTSELLKTLLRSSYFYIMMISSCLSKGSILAFINNVTDIANAVGVSDPLNAVYLMAVITTFTRVTFGVVYDKYNSQITGFLLLLFCYITYCSALLAALFWLNKDNVYVVVFLASIACGPAYTLPLSMVTHKFGHDSYALLTGFMDVKLAVCTVVIHVATGITYDNAFATTTSAGIFCEQCFFWTYVILLLPTVFAIVIQGSYFLLLFDRNG